LIASLHKADLVLRRQCPNLRQQGFIRRVPAASQQMYGNGPPRGNFPSGQRVVNLTQGTGNPPRDLEPLIETHGFPYTRHGLSRTGTDSARLPWRLFLVPHGP
jgi:hypothetical protein